MLTPQAACMTSHPNSQATTYMSSMSPSTPMATETHVAVDKYNALVQRLDAEKHARLQLEAELQAARENAAYFERRLTELTASSGPSLSTSPVDTYATIVPTMSAVATVPSHQHRSSPAHQGKEVLSHCSDISNCKTARKTDTSSSCLAPLAVLPGTSSDPRPSSITFSGHKATSGPVGVVKKTKSKKERPTKVKIPGQSRYWTPEEHKLFLEALQKFGHKDLRSISAHVGTRNMTQVRTHSQKYFMRLMREAKRQNPSNGSSEVTDNVDDVNLSNDAKSSSQVTGSNGRDMDEGDKYSVPSTCGMTLLCLVGQDTLPV